MNHRWLGGTLTNWKTVSNSIKRLKEIDSAMELGTEGLTKKERLGMERDQGKLQASLGGIREMTGTPDVLFVVDVNKESLAVAEANKLGIPVIAVVDSNCSPDGIDYLIPGNDDASRAISFYCDLIARAALEGMTAQMGAAGVDIGEADDFSEEEILAENEQGSSNLGKTVAPVSDSALFVEQAVEDEIEVVVQVPEDEVDVVVQVPEDDVVVQAVEEAGSAEESSGDSKSTDSKDK